MFVCGTRVHMRVLAHARLCALVVQTVVTDNFPLLLGVSAMGMWCYEVNIRAKLSRYRFVGLCLCLHSCASVHPCAPHCTCGTGSRVVPLLQDGPRTAVGTGSRRPRARAPLAPRRAEAAGSGPLPAAPPNGPTIIEEHEHTPQQPAHTQRGMGKSHAHAYAHHTTHARARAPRTPHVRTNALAYTYDSLYARTRRNLQRGVPTLRDSTKQQHPRARVHFSMMQALLNRCRTRGGR